MSWWRRRRYSVWQVQGGERVHLHGSGLTHKQARRDAAFVQETLELLQAIAPTGPQDAHAEVVAE